MGELIALARKLNPADISLPILMMVSFRDRLINAGLAAKTFRRYANPRNRIVSVETSQDPEHHILGGEIVSPASSGILIQEMVAFLNKVIT